MLSHLIRKALDSDASGSRSQVLRFRLSRSLCRLPLDDWVRRLSKLDRRRGIWDDRLPDRKTTCGAILVLSLLFSKSWLSNFFLTFPFSGVGGKAWSSRPSMIGSVSTVQASLVGPGDKNRSSFLVYLVANRLMWGVSQLLQIWLKIPCRRQLSESLDCYNTARLQ